MISDRRLLFLCRDLAAAVRSGLTIGGSGMGAVSAAMAGAAEQAAAGHALHEALAAQGGVPRVFISIVRAGEEGGKLPEFLDRYSDFLETRIEFKRRMKRALAYPAFVSLMATVIFLAFSLYVVPMLMETLQDVGVAPAEGDRWLSRLPRRLGEQWKMILAALLVGGVVLTALSRSREGRQAWSLAGHWLPGIKFMTEQSRLDLFLTTMGILIEAGLPAGAMMDVLSQLFEDDPVICRALVRASAHVAQGRTLSECVGKLLPRGDRSALENAEKAGRLPEVLLRLGKMHREQQYHRLELFVLASKVFSILVVGAMAGGVVWTVLQPVFSLLANPAALIR